MVSNPPLEPPNGAGWYLNKNGMKQTKSRLFLVDSGVLFCTEPAPLVSSSQKNVKNDIFIAILVSLVRNTDDFAD